LTDILALDATGQLQALAARRVSALELLEASVARTDRLNPKLNAVVSRDLDRAYASARLIDDRRARRESLGMLAGLPMTVKDALDVEGLPASAGIEYLLHRTAKGAVVVSRVRAEGAIVWGKTNTPVKAADWQTYNALYGITNNPWDLERTPGGSSGGSAAALAAGLTALEIGADIGGSLRVPASFCGVFAHKPTYGIARKASNDRRGAAETTCTQDNCDQPCSKPWRFASRSLCERIPRTAANVEPDSEMISSPLRPYRSRDAVCV
jgi:amidase